MKNRTTVTLGDFIVAAYDQAARLSDDPEEVNRLAVATVQRYLARQLRREDRPVQHRRAA